MDITTYVLCKNLVKSVSSGISKVEVDGTNLIITTTDGQILTMEFPIPADGQDGLSVKDISIDENNHLICTMSDNSIIDAGELSLESGEEFKELQTQVANLRKESELEII